MAELLSVIILSALAHQPSEQQPRFTNSVFNINNNKWRAEIKNKKQPQTAEKHITHNFSWHNLQHLSKYLLLLLFFYLFFFAENKSAKDQGV